MENIRAEFEKSMRQRMFSDNWFDRDPLGAYSNWSMQMAWVGYTAATEELRSNKKPIAWAKIDEPTGDVLSLGIEALRRFDTPKDTVPLYTHPSAPVVPEGWAVWEASGMGLTENAMVVQHPSGRPRRFFHNNDKERLMYDFLKAMLNAAPESDQ